MGTAVGKRGAYPSSGKGLGSRGGRAWLAALARQALEEPPADPVLLAGWKAWETRGLMLEVAELARRLAGRGEVAGLLSEYLLHGAGLALHALNGGSADPLAAAGAAAAAVVGGESGKAPGEVS